MNTSMKTWVQMKTQKPYYKKSTKKRVEEIEKGIEENKEKFAKRIKQLDYIVKDLNYIPKDSTNGYHEFIQNMHSALKLLQLTLNGLNKKMTLNIKQEKIYM